METLESQPYSSTGRLLRASTAAPHPTWPRSDCWLRATSMDANLTLAYARHSNSPLLRVLLVGSECHWCGIAPGCGEGGQQTSRPGCRHHPDTRHLPIDPSLNFSNPNVSMQGSNDGDVTLSCVDASALPSASSRQAPLPPPHSAGDDPATEAAAPISACLASRRQAAPTPHCVRPSGARASASRGVSARVLPLAGSDARGGVRHRGRPFLGWGGR